MKLVGKPAEKMLTVTIYSLILYILHGIYEIVHVIHNLYVRLSDFWLRDDLEKLSKGIKKLSKRPHHLVFMLGNEEPSFKDLANIVLWTTSAGIPIISFYDHNGVLKQCKSKLFSILTDHNVRYKDISAKQQNGYKNGYSIPPIQINILSLNDGQTTVAEITKECVTSCLKENNIGITYVDEQLKKRGGNLPDPDLAIFCGRICSTFGLLPWQIRLTEFVDIASHHGIHLSNFLSALKRYDKSEQRFGK